MAEFQLKQTPRFAHSTTDHGAACINYGKLIDDWAAAGYAGAQGWAFTETAGAFSWTTGKADVKAWASGKCYVHY